MGKDSRVVPPNADDIGGLRKEGGSRQTALEDG